MIAWLLDTLLYTGALIAAVLVLRRSVARAFGAQTAYALWALPFLRLLLPPIELPASFAPRAVPMVSTIATTDAPAPKAIIVLVTRTPAPEPLVNWPLVALAVWLAGALAFLAWRVVSYRAMRRGLLEGARTVGEVGSIRLLECPAVYSPVAFGVRDKVVALPLLFMAQPDVAARDLAIAHELEHHRGRDLAANFAAQALLALHWFNPLAWLGWRAMRRDQEAACDARVMSGRERAERVRYAELIANTAAGARLALAAPMACPVLGDASIVHRLRSLTMADISPRRRRAGRLLLAGSALALPLTASFSYASAQDTEALPAPRTAEAPPLPPAPPAPRPGQRQVQRFVLGDDGRAVPGERREVRRYVFSDGKGGAPQQFEFHGLAPDDPQYERRMEAWSKQMEKWGERYGKQMEKWGEQQGEQVRRFALVRPFPVPQVPAVPVPPIPPQPHAYPVPPVAPQPQAARVVSPPAATSAAIEGLRGARERIARDPGLTESIRRQVLDELDEEIQDRVQAKRDQEDDADTDADE